MSEMLPIQRRFLILEQGIGTGLINVVLNGVIALLLFHSVETVPLWGPLSIAGDTLATTFLLPLLLCLIATPLARRKVTSGTIPPLTRNRREHWLFRRLPERARLRAVVLGVICTLIVGPLALIALSWLKVTSLPFWDFIVFKALFAGGLAALLGPVVGLWAIVRYSDD
ncbi:MAG: hypothetical protein HON53_09245 [Planctomycetaceae bacterium]|jgi:hypothetical protein|nr:hypothetical protein [Planctomycetaceae bacterium]MBT6153648.1 hypothetical protein [Planctomycetaceae bacterium]MBT6484301.1 hypothetical protein [Planctomycetaceae bacterium]MBT6496669.1 hypothetical protein [Planctomycetaceae bacterium]